MRSILLFCGLALTASAQQFEVASVKLNNSGDAHGSLRRQPGGRVTATNIALGALIGFAWQSPAFLITGAPGWADDERFDIVAKLPGDPPPVAPGAGPDPLALAMQALLADRFKLKVHRETRDVDVYALVPAHPGAPAGPALKSSTQDCSPQAVQARAAAPDPTVACGLRMGPAGLTSGGLPLGSFIPVLSNLLGRQVIDKTGLTGNWDFELKFTQNPGPDSDAPSIFTAVQEQLGLKLQSTKGPADLLVIDSVEHPSSE